MTSNVCILDSNTLLLISTWGHRTFLFVRLPLHYSGLQAQTWIPRPPTCWFIFERKCSPYNLSGSWTVHTRLPYKIWRLTWSIFNIYVCFSFLHSFSITACFWAHGVINTSEPFWRRKSLLLYCECTFLLLFYGLCGDLLPIRQSQIK